LDDKERENFFTRLKNFFNERRKLYLFYEAQVFKVRREKGFYLNIIRFSRSFPEQLAWEVLEKWEKEKNKPEL